MHYMFFLFLKVYFSFLLLCCFHNTETAMFETNISVWVIPVETLKFTFLQMFVTAECLTCMHYIPIVCFVLSHRSQNEFAQSLSQEKLAGKLYQRFNSKSCGRENQFIK